jgi:hypothetical protein
MRRVICRIVCSLAVGCFIVAVILKDLVVQLAGFALICLAFYVVIRVVRWFMRQLAPILRVLIMVAGVGGLVFMTWNDLQSLGGEKLFVVSILLFIACGVLCAPGASRARA